VNRFVRISTMCLVIVLGLATSAFAQPAGLSHMVLAGSAIGVGLTVIGAAYGIGRLAGCALESMARQPEVAGSIQTAMIIAAALIEGFTFFALYICWGQKF
jgi:F-type H+-transporting ATPase subunit c